MLVAVTAAATAAGTVLGIPPHRYGRFSQHLFLCPGPCGCSHRLRARALSRAVSQDAHELLCALLDSLHQDVAKAALPLFRHRSPSASLPPTAASALRGAHTTASLAPHTATGSIPGPGQPLEQGLSLPGPGVPVGEPGALGLAEASGEVGSRGGERTPEDSSAEGRGMEWRGGGGGNGGGGEEGEDASGSGASGRASMKARAEKYADTLCPTCVNFRYGQQSTECTTKTGHGPGPSFHLPSPFWDGA